MSYYWLCRCSYINKWNRSNEAHVPGIRKVAGKLPSAQNWVIKCVVSSWVWYVYSMYDVHKHYVDHDQLHRLDYCVDLVLPRRTMDAIRRFRSNESSFISTPTNTCWPNPLGICFRFETSGQHMPDCVFAETSMNHVKHAFHADSLRAALDLLELDISESIAMQLALALGPVPHKSIGWIT